MQSQNKLLFSSGQHKVKTKYIQNIKKIISKKLRDSDKKLKMDISIISRNLITATKGIDKYGYILESYYEDIANLSKDKIKDIKFELRSNADVTYDLDIISAKLKHYKKLISNGNTALLYEIKQLDKLYKDYLNKAEGMRVAILSKLELLETFKKSKEQRKLGITEKENITNPKKNKSKPPQKKIPYTLKEDSLTDLGIINQKITEAENALISYDLRRARDIYVEILKLYNGLPNERKKLVYEAIKELYDERKNAEKLISIKE